MNRTQFVGASVLCVLLFVSGCVSTTPHLDGHFREIVDLVKVQQTIDPYASRNSESGKGMDGKEAISAYDSYQETFKYHQPPPVSVVLIR